jgi:MtN3 and saliva related transmembrane protein
MPALQAGRGSEATSARPLTGKVPHGAVGVRIVEHMGSEAIGWFSSFVLVLTIINQVYKQWKSGTSKGVSKWLFVGQITASTGFTIYSVMVDNWVFVVTNALMLMSALVGIVIVMKHRRAERRTSRRDAAPAGARPVRA